jgi:hypothetical protein
MVFSWLPVKNMALPTPLARILLIALAFSVGLSAQQPLPRIFGNPTPGTLQPDPPKLADRVTVNGCVKLAEDKGRVPAAELNTSSDNRFVLVSATPQPRVMYRLSALNSALVPFVGARVELAGEVDATEPAVLRVGFIQRVAKTCE